MNRPIAIILLIAGGIAMTCALAFADLMLAVSIFPVGIVLAIALCIGVTLLLDLLRKKLSSSLGIGTAVFICSLYLPALAVALLSMGIVFHLDNSGYWDGQFFGGLFEYLLSLSGIITSAALPVMMLLVLLYYRIVGNISRRKDGG